MKKLVLTMGLLASIFFGQNTYAQCNDTLSVRMENFYSYWWYSNEIEPIENSTIITADSTKDKQNTLFICIAFINNTERAYTKRDTFGFHMVLTTGNDTIFDRIFYTVTNSGIKPGDTVGSVTDSTSCLYQYLKKGTYKVYTSVIYTSRDGYFCDSIVELSSKTVTFYVDTKAAVQQVAQETSLNVFPNPARERISVSCETEMRRVTLCNALGQQVLRVTPNAPQAKLSVSGLPRGLYLLRVETVGGTAVRKVVVE